MKIGHWLWRYIYLLMPFFILSCNIASPVVLPPSSKGLIRFRLRLDYVEVARRDAKGHFWDPGLSNEGVAPDLYYTLSVEGARKYLSPTIKNRYIAQWLEKSDVIDLPADAKLTIAVYDKDRSVARTGLLHNQDDIVGTIELNTEELTDAAVGRKEIRFGQVERCRIVLHNLYRK
jgi:hypothetical protein